jgi:hypothetical protein
MAKTNPTSANTPKAASKRVVSNSGADQANISKALAEFSSNTAKLITAVNSLSTKVGKSSAAMSNTDSNSEIEEQIKLERLLLEIQRDKLDIQDKIKQKKANEIDYDEESLKIKEAELRLAKDLKKANDAGDEEAAKKLLKDRDALKAQREYLEGQRATIENAKKLNDASAEATVLIEKSIGKVKSLGNAFKDPAKAVADFGEKINKSIDKEFSAALDKGNKKAGILGYTLQAGLVGGLLIGVARAFEMNQELIDMRRNIGLSAEKASHVHHELQAATLSSTVLGATSHDTAAAFESLRGTFGTAVASNHELIDSQVLLTKQIGMTNEEATSFQSLSAGTGKSVKENLTVITKTVEQYNQMTGDSVSVRDIQKDISKVSKTSLASYKGFGPALVKAVTVAKRLGMSIEDTVAVSKSLLEIESSLGAEMEASVLVGRSVNMNAARQLALQGKSVEAAEAALQAVGSYDDFMNLNIIQQEALAKAAGMTVDQIVTAGQEEKKNAIMKRKSFRELSKEDKAQLVAQKLLTEKEIKDNILAEQTASIKERIVQLTDQMMTGFDKFITNSIEPYLDYLEKGVEGMRKLAAETKAFIKQSFPTWAIDLMKGAGSLLKGALAIGAGLVVLRKSFGMVSGFLSGKAGDSKSKPIWARIVDGATAVKGAMGRGVDKVKSFGGGVVDKVKSIGGFGKGLLDKFKTFKSAKKEGGLKAGLKSLFTKENLAEITGGATGVATDAITETPVTDTGIAPLGTEADPIYVKVIGGISGGTATEEAADAGGNPLVDAGLDMFKNSKIGKKFSKMTGGLSDTLLDEVGGGGMGGDSTAAATDAAPMKKDGTPDKRFKANKAPSSSPTPSTPSSSGKGGGFFSGLIDKVKSSKFVGKVGDFAKKLNPLSALKKVFTEKSTISKLLGKIPKVGSLVAMASTLYSLGSTAGASGGSFQDVGKQLVMTLGDLGGSVIGGLLGSLGGPAAIAGSILGGMAGSALAGVIADNVDLSGLGKMVVDILGPSGEKEGASPVAVQDALIRPGMPPITFDKGDMILAGTNLMGGGAEAAPAANNQGSLTEVAGLLKQLIAATSQPVKINIGGKVIDEIEKQTTLRKTYNTKVDNVHGAF